MTKTRDLYRQGMTAFSIQMMLSFMLTDDKKLRCCKHCQKVFMAGRPISCVKRFVKHFRIPIED